MENFEATNRYKILVVDDNLINRKIAIGFLENYGFDLMEAASGAEAIEQVKKTKFDMIFMDHMMPEMDGIEAARRIRKECGDNGKAPVMIALTANDRSDARDIFLKNGFQDFITKPLGREPLDAILSQWVPGACGALRENDAAEESERLEYEDIRIPGILVEEARKHHSGEACEYLELLRLYCMDGKRKRGYLAELLEKGDYQNYRIEVHGLKSASANVGAMEICNWAGEQEEAAIRGDVEFIRLHADEFLYYYEAQIKVIECFLKAWDEAEDKDRPEAVLFIDETALLQQVKEALALLEAFHSKECLARIEGLMKYQMECNAESCLRDVREQLKLYEDDKAEEILRHLIDRLEEGGMTGDGE